MADETTGAHVPADADVQDHADELETAGEQDSGEESSEQASQNDGETGGERPHRLSGAQRNKIRIERLERELQEERRTRQQLMDHILKSPAADTKKETAAPAEDKRPRKEDFIVDKEAGTYDADKYEDALLDWNRRQAKKELLEEIDKRDRSKSQQTEQQRIEQSWREKESAFEADHEDYQELSTLAVTFLQRNQQSPTAQAIGAAITESEIGPELLRYLGEDYEALERISKLSPMAAVRELGKIEGRLAKEENPAESQEADEEEELTPAKPQVKAPPKPPTLVKKTTPTGKPFNPLKPETYGNFKNFEKQMNARK